MTVAFLGMYMVNASGAETDVALEDFLLFLFLFILDIGRYELL